jgi:AcrR family transcriptional regulator
VARTREDPAIRQDQILDQAMRAIGERGYYGFTIPQLAKRCGLSNAGLLYHFPSKDHLLLAVLRRYERRETSVMEPLVRTALTAPPGPPAMNAALDVLRAMVFRGVSQPDLSRLFAELQIESLNEAHPAYGWWQEREAALLALLTQLVGPYVVEPNSTALQLAAMLDGLFIRWLRAGRAFNALSEWDRAIGKLLPEFAPVFHSPG